MPVIDIDVMFEQCSQFSPTSGAQWMRPPSVRNVRMFLAREIAYSNSSSSAYILRFEICSRQKILIPRLNDEISVSEKWKVTRYETVRNRVAENTIEIKRHEIRFVKIGTSMKRYEIFHGKVVHETGRICRLNRGVLAKFLSFKDILAASVVGMRLLVHRASHGHIYQ